MTKTNFRFYRCVPTYVSNIEHQPFGREHIFNRGKTLSGVAAFQLSIGNHTYARTEIYFIHRNIYVRTYTYTTAIAIGEEQPQ